MIALLNSARRVACVGLLLLVQNVSAQTIDFGPARDYNAFVFEDWSAPSSDVEGRLAAGGDVSLNHYSVGDKLGPDHAGDVLVVGGNLSFPSGQVYFGNIVVGGDGSGVGSPVLNGLHAGASFNDFSALPVDFGAAYTHLRALSDSLSVMPANGTFNFQWGGLYLSGDCSSDLQVFNLDGGQVLSAHTFQVDCVPADAHVVINISGSAPGLTNMSLSSLSQHRERVVFNFFEASSLTLSGIGVEGSILAPDAVIDNPQGVIYGQLVSRSWNGQMQLNHHVFQTRGGGSGGGNSAPVANDVDERASVAVPTALQLMATDADGDSLSYTIVAQPQHGSVSVDGDVATYIADANYLGSDSFTFKANDGELDSNVATVSVAVGADYCAMYPITFADDLLGNASPGQFFSQIKTGTGPGNFNWLTWTGSPDTPTLIDSLTTPNSHTYVNPDDADDSTIDIGDWLQGKPGVSNASGVRAAMDALIGQPIVVPLFDQVRGQGNNFDYETADFAQIRLSDYKLNGKGWLSFTYDGGYQCINHFPVADDQSVLVEQAVAITLTASDADGDVLTYSVIDGPQYGTLSGSAPNLTYTPNAGFTGTDTLLFVANDGNADSNVAMVTLDVVQTNQAPVANDIAVSGLEDQATAIVLQGSDADGDTLTFTLLAQPAHGTLSGSADNWSYLPNANFHGADSFTYQVDDGQEVSNVATVSITIIAVNDVPVAQNVAASTNEDTAVVIDLVGGDIDGDPLSYVLDTSPSNGTVQINGSQATYQPNPNQHGVDTFSYRVNDGTTDSDVAVVTIDVIAQNDAPTGQSQSLTTSEDNSISVTLLGFDVDGDALSYTLSQPTSGTLQGTAPNLVYTPNADYSGADAFSYSVSDGASSSPSYTIDVTVTPVNDAPVANDQALVVDEDQSLSVTLSASDVDQDALSYSVTSQPAHGALSGTAPNLTYQPNEHFNGQDQFTFVANDGTEDSPAATVSITINAVNDLPLGAEQSLVIPEDQALAIVLAGTDPDADTLSYIVSNPANGTLMGTAPNLTYTPDANFNGSDAFTYRLDDGTDTSEDYPITIDVTAVNDAPLADGQNLTVDEDNALNVVLTGSDADQDALTFNIVSGPVNGTLNGVAPNLSYQPNQNFNGSDQFEFVANDGVIDSNVAIVTIQISAVNDRPVADAQAVATDEDQALALTLAGSDVDGDALSFAVVDLPQHGELTGDAPNLTYTPDENYFGVDSISFTTNDGTEDSELAVISLTVNAVNDEPTGANQALTTNEDTALLLTLSSVDVDDDTLSYMVTEPANGSLTGTAPNLTYQPNPDFAGGDAFTYSVGDGQLVSDLYDVTITVEAVNDAPIAEGQSLITEEDTTIAVTLVGSDVDGDTLSFAIIDGPANGLLAGGAPSLSYTPNADFNGIDQLTFKVNDSELDSELAVVAIEVTPVNDAPVADAQTLSVQQGSDLPITLTASDVDGDVLGYAIVQPPQHGTLTGVLPDVTYTPASDYSGVDSFVFEVDDQNGGLDDALVSINVQLPPQPPEFVSVPATSVNEGALFSYLAEAIDPNDDLESYGLDMAPAGTTIDAQTGLMEWVADSASAQGVRGVNTQCRLPPQLLPSGTLEMTRKWQNGGSSVNSMAVVGPFVDTNSDGVTDRHDMPTVIVLAGGWPDQTPAFITAYNGDTGAEYWHSSYTISNGSTTALGDIDNDGKTELIGQRWGGGLIAYNGDGSIKFESDFPPTHSGSNDSDIHLVDLEGDGEVEILLDNHVINFDGTQRFSIGPNRKASPTVADLDSDGVQEIIIGSSAYTATGDLIWSNANATGRSTIVDLDLDGTPEIVLSGSSIYALSADGQLLWQVPSFFSRGGGAAAIGDVDGDGYPEIGIGAYRKYAVFEHDGTLKWEMPIEDNSSAGNGSSFFDLNGDGAVEVFYRDAKSIWIFEGRTGRVLTEIPSTSPTSREFPVVADVDADGHAELVVSDNVGRDFGSIVVFESVFDDWVPTRGIFNQYDYRVTNVTDDGAIPAVPLPSWTEQNTVRTNAFPDRTSLGLADLAVFDLAADLDAGSVSVVVKNRGLAAVDGAQVSIYAGTSLLGSMDSGVLASGAEQTLILDNLDSAQLESNLVAVVDEANQLAECDEGNNHSIATLFKLRATDETALFDQQVFHLLVEDVNEAPAITSSPNTEATIGSRYDYLVTADDPDMGEGLSYSIAAGPPTAVINDVSGLLQWRPLPGDEGTVSVTVQVTDLRGASVQQQFELAVGDFDQRPEFVSTPVDPATGGADYHYDVDAVDPEGTDTISYRLETAPDGMTIANDSGQITWLAAPVNQASLSGQDSWCDARQIDPQTIALTPRWSYEPNWTYGGEMQALSLETEDEFGQQRSIIVAEQHPASGKARLYAFDPSTGTRLWGSESGVDMSYRFPSMAFDSDADGLPELFAVSYDQRQIHRFSSVDGALIESVAIRQLTEPFYPGLADFDGDGQQDLLLQGEIVSLDGTVLWSIDGPKPSIMRLADLDGDGQNEVLAGSSVFSAQGDLLFRQSEIYNVDRGQENSFTLPVQLDDDADLEIVIAGAGRVFAYDHNFQQIWGPVRFNNQSQSRLPVIGDVDNDGWSDIVIAQSTTHQHSLLALDRFGQLIWMNEGFSRIQSYPLLVDIEGDGYRELVVTDGANLRIFDAESGTLRFEKTEVSGPSQLVMDVDQDGRSELVYASGNGTEVYDFVGPSSSQLFAANSTYAQAPELDLRNVAGLAARTPLADLAIGLATLRESSPTIDVRLVNASDASIDTPFVVNAYDQLDQLIASTTVASLPANTVANVAIPVLGDLPTELTVIADQQHSVAECHEDNNVLVTPLVAVDAVEPDELYSTQRYYLNLFDAPVAPTIVSSAPTSVLYGDAYGYRVRATDQNIADGLTFSVSGPNGMVIDPVTGMLVWQPGLGVLGDFSATVTVTDSFGLTDSQVFTVSVLDPPGNDAPDIVSIPGTGARVGLEYGYDLIAVDPDGDSLSYTLVTGPAAATVSAQGQIRWTPAAEGAEPFSVEVSDGVETVQQDWTVVVVDASIALQAFITADPQQAVLGEPVRIETSFAGAASTATTSLVVDGQSVSMDVNGVAVLSAPALGNHSAEFTVDDGYAIAQASVTFSVVEIPTNTPPVISISSPSEDSEITAPTDVIGSVADDDLSYWLLAYRDANGSNADFVELASGIEPIDGVLGQFDPTLLLNGQYDILLQAEDQSGNFVTDIRTVRVTGDMKVGHFSITFEDLSVPVSGIPITVTRTYDTRQRNEDLDFGKGWTIDYQNVRVHESRDVGFGWSLNQYRTGPYGAFVTWCVEPNGPPIITVTLPDGDVETFEAKAGPECSQQVPIIDVVVTFEGVGDTHSTLVQNDHAILRLYEGKLVEVGQNINQPIDPDRYTLTTREGYVYKLNQGFTVTSVIDPVGNSLTFDEAGITHSAGKSLEFVRDAFGRITQINAPDGEVLNYEYDINGDLVRYTDALGNVTEYTYLLDHFLEDIIDPRGIRVARNEYDEDGRLVAHIDAEGNRIEYTHDIDGRTELIKDRRGFTNRFIYNDRGDVVSETNALGETTLHSYDQYGNELSRTDALGNTTSWTIDLYGNQLTETNALGEVTTSSYGERNVLLTQVDAAGITVIENGYDSRNGQLLSTKDALGNETTFSYDTYSTGFGNLIGITDALGNVTSNVYHGVTGEQLSTTDARGTVTTYTRDEMDRVLTETTTRTDHNGVQHSLITSYEYDANGNVITVTDPLGNITRTEYNEIGKQSATVDALGNRTEYEYDDRGHLVLTRYADGATESTVYDEEGNTIAQIDRAGRTTLMVYDAANRLVETIYPDDTPADDSDNPRTASEYDAAGRMVASIDERGNRTEYEYDAVGRRTLVRDALGFETTFEYDLRGQRTATVDALGRRTEFSYDDAGRLSRTTFDDGTYNDTVYDALGRKTQEIDQAGIATIYEYDANGNLTAVVDALSQRTEYEYDEHSNKTIQRDALGRETQWRYDNGGRVINRVLPLGQIESFSYDANSNRATRTDFNGAITTYGYDNLNRPTLMSYGDGTSVVTSYNVSGQTDSVTDEHGVTSYTYDVRDRLARIDYPNGSWIEYDYDLAGNRTQLLTANQQVDYTFDVLNRLATVTDTNGTTTYSYTPVGSRAAMAYPNGTSVVYTYDDLNRLSVIDHRDIFNTVISRQVYTVGPTGNRLSMEEVDGRRHDYSYDDLYRLTNEQVTDALRGDRTTSWTFDAVGNRLTQTDAAGVTSYVYDTNDRLLTETKGGSVTSYIYDANGNTLEKRVDGVLDTDYVWNVKDKLVEADVNGSTVSYSYDASGIRQTQFTATETISFLVDPNRDYAQVIEEGDGIGIPATYVHGDDLINQTLGGSVSYFHVDGLGSTRALTDDTGIPSDSYLYQAFGEIEEQTGSTENRYLYTGEQFDDSLGMYYLRARYYVPGNGRFASMDTWMGRIRDPHSLHKYLFVHANPVMHVDPSGKFTLIEVSGANMAALRTVGAAAFQVFSILEKIQSGIAIADAIRALRDAIHHVDIGDFLNVDDDGFTSMLENYDEAMVILGRNLHRVASDIAVHKRQRVAEFLAGSKNSIVVFGPTPERAKIPLLHIPLGIVRTGKKARKAFLELGNRPRQGGRAIGLGHMQGDNPGKAHVRQWFRMDWHARHGRESYDWYDDPFHFHVKTAK